jgi:hypothetical protein
MNNWPDPALPGVPLTPERDGWHAIDAGGDFVCLWWISEQRRWHLGSVRLPAYLMATATYLGPIIPPAEVEARIAAAVAEEREACANLCAARPDIAAVLRGEAVAMPREMTEAMFDAAHIEYAYGYGRGVVAIYQRLIEASPYAIKEAARDE